MKDRNNRDVRRNDKNIACNLKKRLMQVNERNAKEHQAGIDYAALQRRIRSVLFECMEYVLLADYNVSSEAFDNYSSTAETILMQYALISRDISIAAAEKWLQDKLSGRRCVLFMLPVIKYPKRGRERMELDFTRRDASVWAKAFCYALGKAPEAGGLRSGADIDEIFRRVAKKYRDRAGI